METEEQVFCRLESIALTGMCLDDRCVARSVSATRRKNVVVVGVAERRCCGGAGGSVDRGQMTRQQPFRVTVQSELDIGPYTDWQAGGVVDCLGMLSWNAPDVFRGGATSMVVGSATLSIAQLMRPPTGGPPGSSATGAQQSEVVGSTQYVPSLSLLARTTSGVPPNTSRLSRSPYARVADMMRSALMASGMDPETAMCVSQTATGCRLDMMLHGVAASSTAAVTSPAAVSVNHTASTTAAAAAARASMAMFKASLPHGVVLSENWYTWLHLHALRNCIDSCVREMREMFGDKGGEEVRAGDTDLAFSRLLGLF
jgi:hypothetical protein